MLKTLFMVKYILYAALIMLFNYHLLAQSSTDLNSFRNIEVNGSAEMELSPNEFYLTILAKEYMDEYKKKVSIDELERNIKEAISKTGIPNENLVISEIESAIIKYHRKKGKDLFLSKSYILKITNPAHLEPLLNAFSEMQLESVELTRTSHSELEKYRIQIKAGAVEAAKKKAENMLAPLGAKVGKVIFVHELTDEYSPAVYNQGYGYRASQDKFSNSVISEERSSGSEENIGFKKIKLRYQVLVRFEIDQ
jgi:uncharacterized protein